MSLTGRQPRQHPGTGPLRGEPLALILA